MAKKTYRTYRLKGLQLLLLDESGRSIEVSFRGGIQIDSTAKFTTSDEKMQGALEKSSGFGRDYYLESVREESPAPAAAPVVENGDDGLNGSNGHDETAEDNGKQKVEVADKAAAIEWMKENHPEKGYTAVKLRSKEAFANACKECGVEFEFNV